MASYIKRCSVGTRRLGRIGVIEHLLAVPRRKVKAACFSGRDIHEYRAALAVEGPSAGIRIGQVNEESFDKEISIIGGED